MDAERVRTTGFAMPAHESGLPAGPYRFVGRQHLVITYRSDPEAIRRVVPEPPDVPESPVHCEFVRLIQIIR